MQNITKLPNIKMFFQEHLSLSEITCVVRYSDDKTLGIFTPIRAPTLAPLQLKFSGDIEMETWQAEIVKGKGFVRIYLDHTITLTIWCSACILNYAMFTSQFITDGIHSSQTGSFFVKLDDIFLQSKQLYQSSMSWLYLKNKICKYIFYTF